jgi:hypothetical protein
MEGISATKFEPLAVWGFEQVLLLPHMVYIPIISSLDLECNRCSFRTRLGAQLYKLIQAIFIAGDLKYKWDCSPVTPYIFDKSN